MKVYTDTGDEIIIDDEPIASGGEGKVCLVSADQGSPYHNTCVKIYLKDKVNEGLHEKIKFMSKNPPEDLVENGFKICWPLKPVYTVRYESAKNLIVKDFKFGNPAKSGYSARYEFVGFVMPIAFPESKKLTILTVPKLSKKLSEDWKRKFDRKEGGSYAFFNRLKLINNLLLPLYNIHKSRKYVIQDLKPDNILVDSRGRVCLVDMDSIQISDTLSSVFYPGSVATAEYIPPEYHRNPFEIQKKSPLSQKWDMFATAVIFYEIMFGIHPFSVTPKNLAEDEMNTVSSNIKNELFPFGRYSYRINSIENTPHKFYYTLPQELKDLFRSSFSANPENRPSAERWFKAIHRIIESQKNKFETPPKEGPKVFPPEPPEPPEPPKPEPPKNPQPKQSDNSITPGMVIAIIFGLIFIALLITVGIVVT